MQRRPKGYLGRNHETIGSDILSVLQVLKLPEHVLGKDETQRLSRVDPNGWYPISWLLELMEVLDQRIGHYGLLQMGRALFKLSHEERVLAQASCARDIVYGIDAMYHFANRDDGIGGWQVLRFDPGSAELEKTTPHHCTMEQGILSAALASIGCPCLVSQRECFRKGADACLYVISSSFTGERWSRPAD